MKQDDIHSLLLFAVEVGDGINRHGPETLLCIDGYPIENGTERAQLPNIDIYSHGMTLRLIVTAFILIIVIWSGGMCSERWRLDKQARTCNFNVYCRIPCRRWN